ncbi:MAG: hypothetical protein IKT28_01955 [Rikenellaceae bacterium]|nr:hypothetical protein [Rikenellaceae bacterium]
MKKIISLLFCIMLFTGVKAQGYEWGVGLRGGYSYGLTAKYNFNAANSLEGILAFNHGVHFTGLYQFNMPVISEGFRFYYGLGGNIGSWKKAETTKFTLGVDGIVGLEYKIKQIPLLLSIDYKPCLNLIGHTGLLGADFAFSVRFTF